MPGRRLALPCLFLAACAAPQPAARRGASPLPPSQEAFFRSLASLCGQAFEGRLVEGTAADSAFRTRRLVLHVRACSADTLRLPFVAGADRSRTWVLSRSPGGLLLTHDHRHADGSEDAVTQYGGTAAPGGSATSQSFPADTFTARLLPAAATNVWTVEHVPGRTFAYQLVRQSTGRRFRVEFDLARPVAPPAAPWGAGVPARPRGQ